MGKVRHRRAERGAPGAVEAQSTDAAKRARPQARGSGVPSLLGPACIVALGMVLYANSVTIPFLFDDYFAIVNEPAVTAIEPLAEYLGRSRGLTALSFALNYQWSGLEVWSYHVVNVAIHLLNGLLVYVLVRRTLLLPVFGGRYARHAAALATLVGLIFVAHPLQTMAASYIVQRGESLAALFYLSALCLIASAATAAPGLPRRTRYVGAGLAALLGVASKEVAVTIAATVPLYYFSFLRGGAPRSEGVARSAARATGPPAPGRRLQAALVGVALLVPVLYALRLSWLYLTPALQPPENTAVAWLYIPSAGFQLEGIPWWRYLLTQFGVIVWYLRLYLLPTRQCFDYGWPIVDSAWRVDVIAPFALLLAIAAAALASWRRYPLATFCLGWFFVTIAPASSIIPLRDAAFEHRMYLPLVGLSWLLVVGGYDTLGWLAARRGLDRARVLGAGAAVAGAWIAALAVATVLRNGVLADPLALGADSATKAPWNWRAQYAFGDALADQKRGDEAIPVLEESIRLNPFQGSPRIRLGGLYLERRRPDDAERVLAPATELSEESVRAAAYVNLASTHLMRGDTDRAEEALKTAAELKPTWSSVRRQLGSMYFRKEFWLLAAEHYSAAIRFSPKLVSTLGPDAARANVRAALDLEEHGDLNGAAGLLRRALGYQPQLVAARHFLAYVYARAGHWARARSEMELVARERPNDALVRANLERARNEQPLERPAAES